MESKELVKAKKVSDIEKRRAQLKRELESLELDIEGNIDDIKESLQQKTDPRHWIRRYPMGALGIAIGVGVLVGTSGRSKKSSITVAPQGPSLFGELKRMIINKGIALVVSSAEDLLAERLKPTSKRRNIEQEK
jgi:ElaB/YqjD/DUF883 family membrane-anchored ribosome-binding protein